MGVDPALHIRIFHLKENLRMAQTEEPFPGMYDAEKIEASLTGIIEDELMPACRCDSASCEACMLINDIRDEIGAT